jgi:O-antigen ligase
MSEENTINGISESYELLSGAEIEDEKTSRLNSAIFVLLCFVPIISTVAYGAVDVWALGFLTIFAGAIAILWLFESFFSKEFRFSTNILQIPVIGLILIGLIQLLPLRSANIPSDLLSVAATNSLSLDAYSTRFAVILLIVYLVFFAAALVFINSEKRLRKIVFIFIVFASIMAFFGILQRLANLEAIYGLRPPGQAIPFASFVNQHHFAAFMVMMLGLTLALIFGKAVKKDKNMLLIIAAVMMAIALILTGSRGAFLSFLGVLVFVIAINLRNKTDDDKEEEKSIFQRKFVIIGGGVVLVLAVFGVVLLIGGNESLLRGTGLQSNTNDLSSGRIHYWSIALKIFLDYPILGAGLNAFGTAFPNYDTLNGTLRVEQAHNDYLQILADAGIVGFTCIAAFIFLLFKKGFQTFNKTSDNFLRNATIGALAGCFGILLHSFFDFPLRTPSNAFFFLILVVIATASFKSPPSDLIKR